MAHLQNFAIPVPIRLLCGEQSFKVFKDSVQSHRVALDDMDYFWEANVDVPRVQH